ncbi:Predicted permease [Malonomonas rubra DSM 5091]|uniref:Predicted permease n=1 Tax=Malonomonas rubra DSM 5091 TaxID=1122189 RepID=A0A1M6HDI8_MALRU|nr:permease [Malonomonas rubra]SHJ20262.1 Predicted permease [Malonomonas rubra DSM 5091]
MSKVGLVYLLIISTVYLFLAARDRQKTGQSLRVAGKSLLKLVPLLIAVFGLVGLFQEFLPPELVTEWLGESSGLLGLLIGASAGAVAIGPPLAAYPLAGSLLDAGAWPPAVAAFIVSWISVGIVTLPFEAQTFGSRFALLRNLISFVAAMVGGLLLGMLL